MTGDAHPPARRLLDDMRVRYGRAARAGCELNAHRDLGFCAFCALPDHIVHVTPVDVELAGWRLLAMAQRGIPDQPARPTERTD